MVTNSSLGGGPYTTSQPPPSWAFAPFPSQNHAVSSVTYVSIACMPWALPGSDKKGASKLSRVSFYRRHYSPRGNSTAHSRASPEAIHYGP